MEENLKTIKEVILITAKKYNIKVDKIILFGSRARMDFRENSDYDLLIVTKNKLNPELKLKFWYEIYKKIDIPVDIIIVSMDTLMKFKEDCGFIYKPALEEGIIL